MSRLQSLSIRAQLSLLIVFITVLPLGLIAYTGYSQRLQALENANRVVDHLADQLANDQRALLAGTEQLLSALAYIPAVQHHDAKATSDLLRKLRDKNQHIANILVMDAHGRMWASALPSPHPIAVDDRRYFRNALATGTFSSGEYTIGKILNKPTLSFGYPIKDSSGKITDIATATFTVDRYDRLLKLPSIPNESSLLIADHRGTILFAHPSKRWIGSLDRQELLARMKSGPDIGRFSAVGITGISRIFAYQKVYLPGEKTPYLYIRAGVSLDSVFSHSNQALLVNISTMLFMLLIMLAITAYVGKRGILDKITALQQATRKVADGDLSVQVSDHVTGGELGTLGRAFDHMVSRLKQTLSERAEVTEKLRESLIRTERFSNALDQVPCYIYMKDDQRRYIYANQLTLDMFGCSREGLQGKEDRCFFPAETVEQLGEIDARVLQGEQTAGELEVVRNDGTRTTYWEVKTPLYDAQDHRIVGLLGVSTDITEQKRSEELHAKNEERLRSIFEASQAGILIVNPGGVITFANRRMAEMFGWEMDEMIGSSYLDNLHPDEISKNGASIQKFISGGDEVVNRERHYRRKDGSHFWGYLSARRLKVLDEQESSFLGIIADITDRKESEEQLRQSEEKFAAIFCSSPDSININRLDDAVFVEVNESFTRMFGYRKDEVAGRSSTELGIWVDPQERPRLAQKLREEGSAKNFESKLRRKDGSIITALISSRLVQIDNVPCTLNIARDITERDTLLNELHRVQKLESLGVLAGGIAHDFNNILTAIMGNLSFARITIDASSKAHAMLENAEKASRRAADLSKQLLAFAKGGQPVKKTVSIKRIVQDALSLALTGTAIRGELYVDPDLHGTDADEGQLSQAFHNIIVNAAHAMPDGGRLTVRGSNVHLADGNLLGLQAGWYVAFSFSDEGCGIAAEDQKKIFDPYFSTKSKGSGLGLASTYAIVKNHGGHIAVESSLGKGSTFTIHLPASGKPMEQPAAEPLHSVAGSGRGTVLVMDDEELIRDLASVIIEHFGYGVKTCANGEEAISLYRQALAAKEPFSAALMDLTISGGMGGEEAARQILAIDPQARLIVSSGYSDNPVIARYESYGFKAAIAKPYVAQQLGKLLGSIVGSQPRGGREG